MKNTLLLIVTIFILTACASKEPKKEKVEKKIHTKSHYYIEEFIYQKDQINFFEKEYENILKLNDKKLLKKFALFYKKNSSYFINGILKAQTLEKRIASLDKLDNSKSHKALLTKALSLNKKDAIKIYEQLAHEGNILAQRELANIYKHDNKLESILWYKKLIENNDIKSIKDFAFANLHMVNPIIVQDVTRAVKLYEKLDKLGEVSGLVHLGNIYEYGYFKDQFPIDKKKSLKYFEKAAKKNYTPAQKKLAKIYLCKECKGDRYNKEKGVNLLNTLIKKGDTEAIKILKSINSSTITKEEKQEELTLTPKIKESVE